MKDNLWFGARTIYRVENNVFGLYHTKIEDGTEVYSLMRESELEADAYLDSFFDTGAERTS